MMVNILVYRIKLDLSSNLTYVHYRSNNIGHTSSGISLR